jgi:hypothetical protein
MNAERGERLANTENQSEAEAGIVVTKWEERRGSEFEGSFEGWNEIRSDDELYAARLARGAPDEAALCEPDQHGIHGRGSEIEELLEGCMGWCQALFVAHHVLADEGEKLALLAGGCVFRRLGGGGDHSKAHRLLLA